MNHTLMYLLGVAVALFAGAALVFLGWNHFITVVAPTVPKVNYWQAMAGVLVLSAVRGMWCCGDLM